MTYGPEERLSRASKKQIGLLTARFQKVSAQFELSKPAPRVVNNP